MDPRTVCLVGLAALVSACGLTDTAPPTAATYTLTSDKPVQLITSTEFASSGTEVALYKSDTVTVSTKAATVSLPDQPRFFIRAIPTASTTNVKLVVDVGSKRWYDASRVISPPDKLEFVYGYTGTTF